MPIEEAQNRLKISRNSSVALVLTVSAVISLFIENGEVVGKWMDVISIYIIPFGALLAGVMFFGFAVQNLF